LNGFWADPTNQHALFDPMQKPLIPCTLVVTTRNEELNIKKCLCSAVGLFDQIFVIDSQSDDRTVEIAKRYAEVVNLDYVHSKIIPWIYQWGLDNLPIRNDWVMILEADQEITPELVEELRELFSKGSIAQDGFFIRRKQIFRGQPLRFGGYGSKFMLKLFRRRRSELDTEEQDTRVYVRGSTEKLQSPIIENNLKEAEILFYLQKHLRYAEAFAREEIQRRQVGVSWKLQPKLLGTPDERTLWLKTRYYRLPLYIRPTLYFVYRYFVLFGFLDGKQGAIFHFLQAFWFRLVMDIRIEELLKTERSRNRVSTGLVGKTK
jgi:glycosyltransferase involved in cell wall biosynthesis